MNSLLDPHRDRRGFSLMEFAITMAVVSTLAGVVSFRIGRGSDEERVAHIVRLVEELETACARYHDDLGSYAWEYTDYEPHLRRLSAHQSADAWKGPYIEEPLVHRVSNPYGSLHVYGYVSANGWIPGFDVDGDGTLDVTTVANMLWLSGIGESVAKRIDHSIDWSIPGDWDESGRVRWDERRKTAYVLVYR